MATLKPEEAELANQVSCTATFQGHPTPSSAPPNTDSVSGTPSEADLTNPLKRKSDQLSSYENSTNFFLKLFDTIFEKASENVKKDNYTPPSNVTLSSNSHSSPIQKSIWKINDFDAIKEVGEGSYGVVYSAFHRPSRQTVALKKMKPFAKIGIPRCIISEIALLKSCQHKNILQIHNTMVAERPPNHRGPADLYIITPYISHDLYGLLLNPKFTFSLPFIKHVSLQLLTGIKYLHSKDIIHRDIKPSNLLITRKGVLKIADFGLARRPNNGPMTPQMVTHWYRSPEICLGSSEYAPSTDMWSIGCVITEMLRGFPLFLVNNHRDFFMRLCHIFGKPDEETLDHYSSIQSSVKNTTLDINLDVDWNQSKAHFDEKFQSLNGPLVALVKDLLCLDPRRRITAAEAVHASCFSTLPMPAVDAGFEEVVASHESTFSKLYSNANQIYGLSTNFVHLQPWGQYHSSLTPGKYYCKPFVNLNPPTSSAQPASNRSRHHPYSSQPQQRNAAYYETPSKRQRYSNQSGSTAPGQSSTGENFTNFNQSQHTFQQSYPNQSHSYYNNSYNGNYQNFRRPRPGAAAAKNGFYANGQWDQQESCWNSAESKFQPQVDPPSDTHRS